MRLQGKVAIVTGGGRGLGAAYVMSLAANGAAVLVADIDQANAEKVAGAVRADGGQAAACFADVADPASSRNMAAVAAETFGGIDILVNNAALLSSLKRRSWEEIEPAEFDQVMAVNVRGTFFCCRAVVPHMRRRGGGKIINIGSSSVFTAHNRLAHYLISKMAIEGITRAVAREVGDDHICVNTLIPGLTDSGAALRENQLPGLFATRAGDGCIRRVEVPADLVGTILFLASSDSDFVTGQSILVDGGRSFH